MLSWVLVNGCRWNSVRLRDEWIRCDGCRGRRGVCGRWKDGLGEAWSGRVEKDGVHRWVGVRLMSEGLGAGVRRVGFSMGKTTDELARRMEGVKVGAWISREHRREIEELVVQLEEEQESKLSTEEWRTPVAEGTFSVRYMRLPGGSYDVVGSWGRKLRKTLNRMIFRVRYFFYHFQYPMMVHMIQFKILGILPGSLTVKGHSEVVPGRCENTVQVSFDRPRLTLGRGLNMAVGTRTSITLTTTYDDGRILIARGKRGSLFIFERDDIAAEAREAAQAWKVHLAQRPLSRTMAIGAIMLGLVGILLLGFLIGTRTAIIASAPVLAGFGALVRSGRIDGLGSDEH
uniref:Plastid lipid-associated protein/fibrillin conserved domain-containing protein n=1 Tax=Compsopogon caeruleus TaxID=31354 RepID=A0A7S1XC59_9RHOD|mmetsp:Transcript_15402/g.31207  ORF Transcript_15402/g.31207 Transcript_15402/m.31207 type:complete len:344 (+) Transcript_15402:76-1107(+)